MIEVDASGMPVDRTGDSGQPCAARGESDVAPNLSFLAEQAKKKVGPRGGDLTHPRLQAQYVRDFDEDGLAEDRIPLHRAENGLRSAMPAIKNEQPWHRMAAYMLLNNCSNVSIAEAANVTPQSVSILRSQPWFQQLLAELSARKGDDITSVIQSYALEAVEGIHTIAVSAESDRVRLSAYTTLLEHAQGKPVQKNLNLNSSVSYSSPEEERRELEAQLEAIRKAKEQSL